jgi:hypothetical protein
MDIGNEEFDRNSEIGKLESKIEKENTLDFIGKSDDCVNSQTLRVFSVSENRLLVSDDNQGVFSKTEVKVDEGYNVEGLNIEIKDQTLDALTKNDDFIIKLSKVFKVTAILNLIFDFLFALTLPHLLPLILFNILGYFASKRFSLCMSIGYFIYNILVIISRILLMIFFPIIYVIVIYSLLVIVQIAFMMFQVLFISSLYEASTEQFIRILTFVNEESKK